MSSSRLVSRILPASTRSFRSPLPTSAEAKAKVLAGFSAVEHSFDPSRHRAIGIGSGSTIVPVVQALAEMREKLSGHVFIPTGHQSAELLKSAQLRIGNVGDFDSLDIAFDGADDVDAELNVIKGGGACHLREKVVMEMSRHNVIVADWRKDSKRLGEGLWTRGIPLEVVPFAVDHIMRQLKCIAAEARGGLSSPINAALRLGGSAKAGPVVSDNGNFIVDLPWEDCFSQIPLMQLQSELKRLTGVVEVGLFVGQVQEVYFGREDGTVLHKRKEGFGDGE